MLQIGHEDMGATSATGIHHSPTKSSRRYRDSPLPHQKQPALPGFAAASFPPGGRSHFLAPNLGQPADQVDLLIIQPGGSFHHRLHQQIAPTPTLQPRHPPALDAKHPPGLGAGRDIQILHPVQRLVLDVDPEGGLGHGEVDLVQQVVAVALEPGMRAHLHMHVQVSGRTPRGPTAPRPVTRSVDPWLTPAGMVTL